MRIAWVTSGFSKDENDYGGSAAIHNLAREISQNENIELVIFSFYYPHGQSEYGFYKAKVYSFSSGIGNPTPYTKLKIWNNCIKAFNAEHKKNKFNLIHSFWAGEPGYIASKLARRHSIPLIANICGGELAEISSINYGSRLKLSRKKLVDKTFRRANIIISGCDFITEKLKLYYPEDIYNKTVKIPFGVDEKKFTVKTQPKSGGGKITLINIANGVPVKAHSDLFRAVSIVKEKYPALQLLCCGREESGNLQKMVNDMNLQDFVKLKGFIEYDEIPSALSNADIFVLSSLYESQNMSILEAAFCGLTAVSTDVGIAPELTPYISKAGDHSSLAENIIKAIENPGINYTNLHERFSLKSCTSKFIEHYVSLAQLTL